MKWQYIFEAIVSAPAILLEQITEGAKNFLKEEKELSQHGEFEEED